MHTVLAGDDLVFVSKLCVHTCFFILSGDTTRRGRSRGAHAHVRLSQIKTKPKSSERLTRRHPLTCNGPGPPSAATRRAMHFVRRFASAWMALPWVLLIAVLVNARRPPPLPRSFRELSPEEISSLVKIRDPTRNLDPNDPTSHLSKILIPRPRECVRCLKLCHVNNEPRHPRIADTANNTQVRNYIIDTLKRLKWHIEEDTLTAQTPYGVKTFTNVIATKDPEASRRVIVAAHFDSKYFPSYPENQVRVERVQWSSRVGMLTVR